jgi:GNAT superfamily N-acetyltransferase
MSRSKQDIAEIHFQISPPVSNEEMNTFQNECWEDHVWTDYQPVFERSLAYICAYSGKHLIGFVNLAWNGGEHGFILDTLVHPDQRRHGIGRKLVLHAIEQARERGLKWVHVDFESHLKGFYEECGFFHTEAGLVKLR